MQNKSFTLKNYSGTYANEIVYLEFVVLDLERYKLLRNPGLNY